MMARAEADLEGSQTRCFGERRLDARGGFDVGDHAAALADQVMMVAARQLLGQLEAALVVVAGHPVHDTGLGQHGQRSIRRALGEARAGRENLGHRERSLRAGEHVDERLTAAGIALLGGRQATSDPIVKASRRGRADLAHEGPA